MLRAAYPMPPRLERRLEGSSPIRVALDHDDFGLKQSKVIVIDSYNLERDASGKPVPSFPHPALKHAQESGSNKGMVQGEIQDHVQDDVQTDTAAKLARTSAAGSAFLARLSPKVDPFKGFHTALT
ncbi:MAG: hypothetical protein WCF20_07565 [Methylovirgula sp.]